MSAPATKRMTVDEYYEITVEGDRLQLVEGELIVNDPTPLHALAQVNILTELTNWARAEPGRGVAFSPIDVRVDEHNLFGPDVVWLRETRVPADLARRLDGLPDLAVEVRSPATWRYDVGKKRSAYERAGLPELWLVDTSAESVLVFRRSTAAAARFDVELELSKLDAVTSPLLPGFSVAAERVFRR
ncbi:MAG TPA: Uma2 family endonuclease [Thermoleophilaceae bacterium]|nr:Uma2 family endonuclease [Thermoleophilaceae bacterium]